MRWVGAVLPALLLAFSGCLEGEMSLEERLLGEWEHDDGFAILHVRAGVVCDGSDCFTYRTDTADENRMLTIHLLDDAGGLLDVWWYWQFSTDYDRAKLWVMGDAVNDEDPILLRRL
jgi:hypothetical protein